MEKAKVEHLCNDANKVFIAESLSGYQKYEYLPQWLKNKSLYLSRERSKMVKNYRVYKRGSIVYVDFGVNVGHELSGNHFAIVINNKDNCKNGVLSVIPISSKSKKCYVPLGKIINLQSIKHFAAESDKIIFQLKILLKAGIEAGNIKDNHLNSKYLIDLVEEAKEITGEEAKIKAKEFGLRFDNNLDIVNSMAKLGTNSLEYRKVFTAYQKYTKECYAMPLNVQSISKLRIRKINRYDPSGKMGAPYDVMDKIDKSIIDRFTKK